MQRCSFQYPAYGGRVEGRGVPGVRGHDRVFLLPLVCTAGDRHVRAGNQLCRSVVFSIPLMVGGWGGRGSPRGPWT